MERQTQWIMGTRLTIAIPEDGRAAAVLREAFAIARDLDDLLSDYKPESPLSRVSLQAPGVAARVDPRLAGFLRRALEDSRRTRGTFDVTIGALMHLYRSGKADAESVRRAREATGNGLVEVGAEDTVRLARAGVRLDAGGIGKGYAVDAVVAHLRARGVSRAFIDFGESSFYGLGAPPGRRGWPVLVRAAEAGRHLGVLWLRDAGLSTSISLPRPDPLKSVARGHIVDPRTGTLVMEARIAAAVSRSATDAEVVTKPLIIEPSLRVELSRMYPGAMMLTQTAGEAPVMDPALQQWFDAAP